MRLQKLIIGLFLVLICTWSNCQGADIPPKQLLASQYLRAAMSFVEGEVFTVQGIDGAIRLASLAAVLAPDNAETWRALVELIDLGDRPEDDELRVAALRNIARIDPEDDVTKLRLINHAIAQRQTVTDRIEAYENLLAPANKAQLGEAIASRLAFDLALLYSRTGDIQAYSSWLAEAVTLDKSNRIAAAEAAGFFRVNTSNPYDEAELLVNLMLTDPTDLVAKAALAQLLLNQGAYIAADRIYGITSQIHVVLGSLAPNGLLADQAVAQWGRGYEQVALQTIAKRQMLADEVFRQAAARDNPELSRVELGRLKSPIAPTLATIRAAIHNRLQSPEAEASLRNLKESFEAVHKVLSTKEDIADEAIASLYLQQAWVMLWLTNDVDAVGPLLEAAKSKLEPDGINETALTRFEGWIALRQGKDELALELLSSVAEDDVAAKLGLAMINLKQGQTRNCARELLGVVRSQPGSLIGVWASDLLTEIIGRRLTRDELQTQAGRLEELVASIPAVYDLFTSEPTLAVSMRIKPAKSTFDPYEPIIVNLEITNHSPFPMAISSGGPIRPRVIFLPTIQVTRDLRFDELPPIIIDIDRRLRLEPHQPIIIPIDLRRSSINGILNDAYPIRGAMIKIRAVLNFWMPKQGIIRVSVLGSEIQSPSIRVDGVRMTEQWINSAIVTALNPNELRDLPTMGLLSRIHTELPKDAPLQEKVKLLSDAAEALIEGYSKISPTAQAWLLTVITRAEAMKPIISMARKSTNKYVQISYLLYHVENENDPMIEAAERSEDEDVRFMANLLREIMQKSQKNKQ